MFRWYLPSVGPLIHVGSTPRWDCFISSLIMWNTVCLVVQTYTTVFVFLWPFVMINLALSAFIFYILYFILIVYIVRGLEFEVKRIRV